jgi:membrane-associated phospholipid phosphatase
MRSRWPVRLAVIGAATFVALSVLVATHVTHDLDDAAREYFRPNDVWGPTQIRADVIVEGLKPIYVAPVLVLVGVGVSLWRRSWWPAAFASLIILATGALTVLTKLLLQRPDTHNHLTWTGGSFPSGHTAALLVCVGGAVLIMRERSRWWEWVTVALVGLAMGVALLLQAAHWFTDVAGGVLLAVTVLAAASVFDLRRRARR